MDTISAVITGVTLYMVGMGLFMLAVVFGLGGDEPPYSSIPLLAEQQALRADEKAVVELALWPIFLVVRIIRHKRGAK